MYLATFMTHLPYLVPSFVLFILCFLIACSWILKVDKFKNVLLASPFPVIPTLTLLALLACSTVFSGTALLIMLPITSWQLIDGGSIAVAPQIDSVVQVLSTCALLCLFNFFLIFFSTSIWKLINE
jgi:hypothetical protein